jgi:hypothetical protein
MYAALPYALAQGDVEVPYILVQTVRRPRAPCHPHQPLSARHWPQL